MPDIKAAIVAATEEANPTMSTDLIPLVNAAGTTFKKLKPQTLFAAIDALVYKGVVDCSANPNYPAADAGHVYKVSVAGKIGGGSGTNVQIGDTLICNVDSSASGTQAAVGANWNIIQANIDGAYFAGGTDVAVADGGTGSSTAAGARTNLDAAKTDLVGSPCELIIACSDESTSITTGTAKITFRMPYAMTLNAGNAGVRASMNTAPTGSTAIFDIKASGTTILSTKVSIDDSEKTSLTAASAVVISDTGLADDEEITINFDQIGSTIAGKGVKIMLRGVRA